MKDAIKRAATKVMNGTARQITKQGIMFNAANGVVPAQAMWIDENGKHIHALRSEKSVERLIMKVR